MSEKRSAKKDLVLWMKKMCKIISCCMSSCQDDIQQLIFQGYVKMGDVRMKYEDFHSLGKHGQVEDNVILFFMEYHLQSIVIQEKRKEVEILGPSQTYLLMNLLWTPDEEEVFENIKPLNLMDKKLILAVIHNHGHWSLLAFIPSNLKFYHMDSLNNLNNSVARNFAQRLMRALKLSAGHYSKISENQQGNTYDCGLYVIEHCKKTLEHLFQLDRTMDEPFEGQISFKSSEKRQEMLQIVKLLADSRPM